MTAVLADLDPLGARFQTLRAAGRRALIPYITAGYPSPAATLDIMRRLSGAGADIIELGVPFSDPVGDGPTIQRSSQRALEQHVSLAWTLGVLREFTAESDTPVVLFSYLNPIFRFGVDRFLQESIDAGAAGVLLLDLPVGSDDELEEKFESAPISLIRLIAPTTPAARVDTIAARAQGFLYYISRMGVTGARTEVRQELAAEVEKLRKAAHVPIAVGFGISSPDQALEVARAADGIVIGSALIDALDRGGAAAAESFVQGIRRALDSA